ncbi:MAG TPA: dTDP-4-dehydrorhamnose reductase [Thermoleophilaceae bacterium]|nr:dTDP-4-dehydrorhamnose reductase [Thermoleophilaceae bacterium]
MKLLVCGAGGMLGQDVVRAARFSNHEVAALDRDALDVSNERAVRRAMERERPAAVVNCAAYTAVDAAEDDRDAAMRLNADAARTVAAEAAAVGAAVVYPSTDYVFDGTGERPYVESDEPSPQSVYGQSKLAGEVDTAAANPRHFLVRTSWLFGISGRNFVETMLDLGERDGSVVVVRDQIGSPTWTGHLAAGIVRMLDTDAYGLHHLSAAGECSWYDFAVAIFEEAGVDCRVLSTTTAEFSRPAPRPAYSVLGTQWQDAIHLPEWQVGLRGYLEDRA